MMKTRFDRTMPAGSPAPFAAEREPLDEAQRREQLWRPGADLRVGGKQADAERRQPHQHQRPHQHELASQAVAVVTHDDAAKRPRDEADGERGERGQCAGEL